MHSKVQFYFAFVSFPCKIVQRISFTYDILLTYVFGIIENEIID